MESDAWKESNAPLLQREVDIIGKIMFTATHTAAVDCDTGFILKDKRYDKCFPIVDLDEESYFTDVLASDDGSTAVPWARAEDEPYYQASYEFQGELATYSNDGFYRAFAPGTTVEEYREEMKNLNGIFFGMGTRAVSLTFTVYSKITDWWINVRILFEYGIGNQVILARKDFIPFRPNIYETKQERQFLILDIARLCCNITIALVHVVFGGIRVKKIWAKEFDSVTLFYFIFDIFVLAVFIA